MNTATFWKIIDSSRKRSKGDKDDQLDLIQEKLESLDEEEIVEFKHCLDVEMARAYRWDLIGAACFVGCGLSDDGFMDFRAWLVSLGKDTFESVLADPERIAELEFDESPTEEWEFEALHALPGEMLEDPSDEGVPYSADPPEPADEEFTITKHVLRQRYPKLWARFADRWMIGIPSA
jgi:hypothetical protein